MPPPIPIFRNEINALGDFRGGVNVARVFALMQKHDLSPDNPWRTHSKLRSRQPLSIFAVIHPEA
jgi:hypothetical protein